MVSGLFLVGFLATARFMGEVFFVRARLQARPELCAWEGRRGSRQRLEQRVSLVKPVKCYGKLLLRCKTNSVIQQHEFYTDIDPDGFKMVIEQNQIYFALFFFACTFFFYKGFDAIFDLKEEKYQRAWKFLFGMVLLILASLDFYEMFKTW